MSWIPGPGRARARWVRRSVDVPSSRSSRRCRSCEAVIARWVYYLSDARRTHVRPTGRRIDSAEVGVAVKLRQRDEERHNGPVGLKRSGVYHRGNGGTGCSAPPSLRRLIVDTQQISGDRHAHDMDYRAELMTVATVWRHAGQRISQPVAQSRVETRPGSWNEDTGCETSCLGDVESWLPGNGPLTVSPPGGGGAACAGCARRRPAAIRSRTRPGHGGTSWSVSPFHPDLGVVVRLG